MKVRDLIAQLVAIDEVSVLDSDVFFRISGEENDVEINAVYYTDTGDIILQENMDPVKTEIPTDAEQQPEGDAPQQAEQVEPHSNS